MPFLGVTAPFPAAPSLQAIAAVQSRLFRARGGLGRADEAPGWRPLPPPSKLRGSLRGEIRTGPRQSLRPGALAKRLVGHLLVHLCCGEHSVALAICYLSHKPPGLLFPLRLYA